MRATRGAIEEGLNFAATYPGTPSSEITDTLYDIADKIEMYVEYSTNEKVAVELAAGAAVTCPVLRGNDAWTFSSPQPSRTFP
jgi:TPP-dependent indolepyruvate ferredoxin oxidoreductase alpha subunit